MNNRNLPETKSGPHDSGSWLALLMLGAPLAIRMLVGAVSFVVGLFTGEFLS